MTCAKTTNIGDYNLKYNNAQPLNLKEITTSFTVCAEDKICIDCLHPDGIYWLVYTPVIIFHIVPLKGICLCTVLFPLPAIFSSTAPVVNKI